MYICSGGGGIGSENILRKSTKCIAPELEKVMPRCHGQTNWVALNMGGGGRYSLKGKLGKKNLLAQSFYPILTKRSFKRQF